MRPLRVIACIVLPLAGAALGVGCPDHEEVLSKGDAAATTDGNWADGDSGPAWDPVWHLTEPKAWPTVGPDGQPDCGVACRTMLNAPTTQPYYYGYSYDTGRVLAEGVKIGPLSTEFGSTVTQIVGPDPKYHDSLGAPYVSGNRATFVHNFGPGDGRVELMDLLTGETKVVYEYKPAQAGKNNTTRTALNSHFAFWAMDGKGLMSRDLQTGEVRLLAPGSFLCHDICATEHNLLCAEIGVVYVADLDTGQFGVLDNGGALQIEGFCSPDRTEFVWIDYRDPPGEASTYDFSRSGGEVYLRDLVAKKTRRVTYDSPVRPRGKIFPAVDGTRVYWNEPPDGPNENPDQAQSLYSFATVLVRLDLATGQKCKLPGVGIGGYKAAYDSKMITLWLDSGQGEWHVVVIDMADPGLTWQCETVPIPP